MWVDVYIGGTLEQARDRFLKIVDIPELRETWIPSKPMPVGRTFMHYDYNNVVMWLKDVNDVGVVAHEAVHVAFFANEKLGGLFDAQNHETCTYLVEHLVREICKK